METACHGEGGMGVVRGCWPSWPAAADGDVVAGAVVVETCLSCPSCALGGIWAPSHLLIPCPGAYLRHAHTWTHPTMRM